MRPVHNVNIGGLLDLQPYETTKNLGQPKGMTEKSYNSLVNDGDAYESLVNKLHIIKLANNFPANEAGIANDIRKMPVSAVDLCEMSNAGMGAQTYEVEDFIYCKNYGLPINRLITLRRFPNPVTDNIYDKFNQEEPDIARLVTYTTQDTNKIDELMSFSYGMRWKSLQAEMESASTVGDQSGFQNLSKKVMEFIDPTLAQNTLRGQNKLNYDPKHDGNRVYGPVDSITETHIRDVGFDYQKEFDIIFEYDLQSWGGRTPEFAMRDIIANVLAVTYNNGKFWPGSRYWIGERPSQFLDKVRWMNPDSISEFFNGGFNSLKSAIANFAQTGSAIQALKTAMSNGLAMGIGKILDTVGRPSIVVMNSLLSAEPTGYWHLTIGNPVNPQMVMGNLICTGVDFKFPADTLSYLDFPTKLQVSIKLKPGQPKDKAGIEMTFNMGKQRIYHNPQSITTTKSTNVTRTKRNFNEFDDTAIGRIISDTFDFVGEKTVKVVSESGVINKTSELVTTGAKATEKAYREAINKTESLKDSSAIK